MAKQSGYEGYIPSFDEDPEALRRAQARGVARSMAADRSGMRTVYDAYRQKGDPSSEEMISRLRMADEDAVKRMQRRHEDAHQERMREYKRGFRAQGYAEGGPIPPTPRKRNPAAGAGDVTPPPGKDGKPMPPPEFKKFAKGGSVGDGCAQRGRTKGRII